MLRTRVGYLERELRARDALITELRSSSLGARGGRGGSDSLVAQLKALQVRYWGCGAGGGQGRARGRGAEVRVLAKSQLLHNTMSVMTRMRGRPTGRTTG